MKRSATQTLFDTPSNPKLPLAEQVRPHSLDEMLPPCGISPHLWKNICNPKIALQSMILWGPPGSGKTTLARAIGKTRDVLFKELSAVNAGVREVRDLVKETRQGTPPLLLFLDEVHRFNRTQQDILLPLIEEGRIIFIGATTENPSFALSPALLSRCGLIRLAGFDDEALTHILSSVLCSLEKTIPENLQAALIHSAQGDARLLLRTLERYLSMEDENISSSAELLSEQSHIHYDRSGDHHFDSISAFIKSMRSGDTTQALYYGLRMIEAGEDPLYVLRRMIIFASEDIGNAQPQALMIANQALEAYKFLGLPEGKIAITQAICFLSTAPKSRASYNALRNAEKFIKSHPNIPIMSELTNSPIRESPEDKARIEKAAATLNSQTFYCPEDSGYEARLPK